MKTFLILAASLFIIGCGTTEKKQEKQEKQYQYRVYSSSFFGGHFDADSLKYEGDFVIIYKDSTEATVNKDMVAGFIKTY